MLKGGTTVKKWKVLLSIFVLIVAAGGGTLYYFLNVKEYKTKDTHVDKIVKSDYNIKLPDATTKNQDNTQTNTNTNTQNAQTTGQSGSQQQTASNAGGQTGSKAGAATAVKMSAAAIINKYQPVFTELESQANGKIDSLLSYALNEYQNKTANGEEISYFYFYAKYNAAGKQLEASTDASFNYIYNALVNDLKKNGYSASNAEPIKEQYNSLKTSRRSALIKRAAKLF
jgi:hypothetical protein